MPLLVIATPIGNLDDITLRAVDELRGAHVVVAEDTRHTRKLLDHLGVRVGMRSFHEHSSHEDAREIVELARTEKVAFVCDAGTPGISDPGYRLVRLAHEADVQVSPIPGASAVTAFLSASGIPTDRFTFLGFLPAKGNARLEAIHDALTRRETVILYESPRRVASLLEAIDDVSPSRKVVAGRELTKQYEEFVSGSASEVLSTLDTNGSLRGEFVIGIEGSPEEPSDLDDAIPWVDALLDAGLRTKTIAKLLAERLGMSKTDLYQLVLKRSE
jgi:16S rRNA (cytidine1402-2'-O)-methyltransferase